MLERTSLQSVPKSVATRRAFSVAVLLLLAGCDPRNENSHDNSRDTALEVGARIHPYDYDWSSQVGETVTLTGKAVNHKLMATLYGGDYAIYVDLPDSTHWPDGLYHGRDEGEIVQVTGTIAYRKMLPVFVADPGSPPVSGMPVPQGTDLEEAAKAYVLEDVSWKRVTVGADQDSSKKID